MSEKENEKLPDLLEESKTETDGNSDDSDGDDGGFGQAVLELTKKANNCLEH